MTILSTICTQKLNYWLGEEVDSNDKPLNENSCGPKLWLQNFLSVRPGQKFVNPLLDSKDRFNATWCLRIQRNLVRE